MFKKLYLLLVLGAALACKASPSPKEHAVLGTDDLHPDQQQVVVCKLVADMISKGNYKKVPLNDSISEVVYKRYLKELDENHYYLLASDVKSFDKYKDALDDDLKEGNLNDAFYIFNVYQKRYDERVKFSIAHVNDNFNFDKDDNFTYDREDLPWVASAAEMDKIWIERVKYDLLNLKLANPDMAKNRETLRKRYESLLSQSNKLSNQDVFQSFMDAFTLAIDPHTNYFNPFNASQFNMEMSRSLEGIGAGLGTENEYIVIKSVVPGGPADKSKLINVDDRIIGVAQGKAGEFQNVVGWRVDNAIQLIRGTKGTVVRLEVRSKSASAASKPRVVEMIREKIILQDISAKQEIRNYNSNGKAVKIGVITIPSFYMDFNDYKAGNPNYKSVTRDVKLLLDTLKQQNVDGVVIDLRENGGGSLPEAISLAGLFIKTGPVVQVRDTRNEIDAEADDDPDVAYSGPLAVMVDRASASASEIFAGAMQDYGRALIIGSQTYGKGTVQSAINLDQYIRPSISDMVSSVAGSKKPQGTGATNKYGQLDLTIAKFYRISGSSTQHKGVVPDITFPSIVPMDKYGEDTEPSALPFDMIAKADYAKVGDFSQVIPQLNKLHTQRMDTSASFKYVNEEIEEIKTRENEKTVTLNEKKLKQQRDDDEAKSFDRDNKLRISMGLKPLTKGQPKPKKEDLDFFKVEAGQILTDYIGLGAKYTSTTGTVAQ